MVSFLWILNEKQNQKCWCWWATIRRIEKKTKQNKPKVLMENIQKYDQIALHQTPRNAQWHRKEK